MVNKADLTKPRLPEDDVETPVGYIRVRGLSRAEVLRLQNTTDDTDKLDNKTLELAVVEPKLTEAEVKKWREAWTSQDFEPIIEKIQTLSGMNDKEEAVEASFPEQ